MATSLYDFYHQKTDAELQFFADHPEHYQPSLIDAARSELRRRGVAPAPELPPLAYVSPEPTGLRPDALTLGLAAVLLVGLGGFYIAKHQNQPALSVGAARPKAPPRLEEVETSVIPDYSVAVKASVQRQVQRVPAGERATAARASMPMRQYRELAKRFWTAECQTEYVLVQARRGPMDAALPGHIESAMATWQQWNKATAYRYQFGPKMTQHFEAMARVARQQQEGLGDLLIVARNPQPYETAKTRQREADVNDLLSSLLPRSPATGRPYTVLVRKMHW